MKILRHCFIVLFAVTTLTGCLSAKYPNRQAYMFHVSHPQPAKSAKRDAVLAIGRVSVLPQFANNQMVYRVSDMRYKTDYYHIFFIPPAEQFSQILQRWFADTGKFRHVTLDNAFIKPHYRLQARITKLYADYRDRAHPHAVVQLKVWYFRLGRPRTILLFQNTYEVAVPIGTRSAECLMSAWNEAIKRLLMRLNVDVV